MGLGTNRLMNEFMIPGSIGSWVHGLMYSWTDRLLGLLIDEPMV